MTLFIESRPLYMFFQQSNKMVHEMPNFRETRSCTKCCYEHKFCHKRKDLTIFINQQQFKLPAQLNFYNLTAVRPNLEVYLCRHVCNYEPKGSFIYCMFITTCSIRCSNSKHCSCHLFCHGSASYPASHMN